MMPLKDDNPTSRTAYLTIGLIVINIVVFLWQLYLGQEGLGAVYLYGAVPSRLFGIGDNLPSPAVPEAVTLITAMFLHGGFLHIIGNMLYLWIFGNNVEDVLGRARFILFYLVCGLIATFSHLLSNVQSQLPMIGASGAIAGILGAYLVLFPRTRVHTLFIFFVFIRVIPIPAVFLLIFWFVLQLFSLGSGGGVAWTAHIGGFLAGLVLIRLFLRGRPLPWQHSYYA
ncbi:rhomboid family intramembrane serine protease [candidate division KSB1 bacterium]